MLQFKKCYTCKLRLPIFLYKKVAKGDYSVKSAKGCLISCKICNLRRFIRTGSSWYRENRKWRKIDTLKEFIKIL